MSHQDAEIDRCEGAARNGAAGRALSPWLTIIMPIAVVGAIVVVHAAAPGFYSRYFESEFGVIENLQAALALVPIVFGLLALRRGRLLPRMWLRAWIALICIGCLYLVGEELSWGQHWAGWVTPDTFQRVNDQSETNLHNISSWLDQKPRVVLEVGILIGGLILPIVFLVARPRWQGDPADWRWWLLPDRACVPIALLAVATRLPERVSEALDAPLRAHELRYSEIQELCFTLFLIFYLASIHVRLKSRAAGGAPGSRNRVMSVGRVGYAPARRARPSR